jgi:hypothetical protein
MWTRYLDEVGFFLYSRHFSLVVSFTLVLSCRDDVSVATYRDQRKRVVSTEHRFSFESNMAVNLSIGCVPTFSITRSEKDSRYCIGKQMED